MQNHNPGGARLRSLVSFLVLSTVLATAGSVHAQNARIVTASTTDGTLRELDFGSSSSQVLNTDAGARTRFQSVVYRNDGAGGVHCIAADDLAGQVLYYADAMGNGQVILDQAVPGDPKLPAGLSLDAARNLYGLSVDGAKAGLWVVRRDAMCIGGTCLAGGYDGPVGFLDTNVGGSPIPGVDRLAETLVITAAAGVLVPGDVLVLSNSPAQVLLYAASDVQDFLDELSQGGTPAELQPTVFIDPPDASVPDEERFPSDARPIGFAIEPGGNLLITSGNGVVYNFLPDGTRLSSGALFVDFVTGLASGNYKIAAGNQDGEARAFLSDLGGGQVLRYTIEADGTGTLDASVTGLATPLGIATTTSSIVQTPAGPGVTVTVSNLMTSRISNVVSAGTTNITEFIFEDPREAEISTPVGQPLHRSLFLDEVSALLPVGIEIPDYVRAFRKDDPVTGPPTFILLVVDTSYQVVGPIDHEADESLVLGYDPDCNDPDPTLQPRMFWVPNLDEPPSPESPRFINVSTACGPSANSINQGPQQRNVRSKGVTRNFSLFLIGARDTRPWSVTAQAQLDGLGLLLAASTCISQPTLGLIESEFAAAEASFATFELRETIEHLRKIVTIVQSSPAALAGCPNNEGGGLVARSLATIFSLGFSLRDADDTGRRRKKSSLKSR